jgi:hypothetical protein
MRFGAGLRRVLQSRRSRFHRRRVAFGSFCFGVTGEGRRSAATGHVPPDDQRDVVVKRAGMGLLVVDAEFGKDVEYNARLHFELACQLIDPDFAHTVRH